VLDYVCARHVCSERVSSTRANNQDDRDKRIEYSLFAMSCVEFECENVNKEKRSARCLNLGSFISIEFPRCLPGTNNLIAFSWPRPHEWSGS
jgi:hypothetical protein